MHAQLCVDGMTRGQPCTGGLSIMGELVLCCDVVHTPAFLDHTDDEHWIRDGYVDCGPSQVFPRRAPDNRGPLTFGAPAECGSRQRPR